MNLKIRLKPKELRAIVFKMIILIIIFQMIVAENTGICRGKFESIKLKLKAEYLIFNFYFKRFLISDLV